MRLCDLHLLGENPALFQVVDILLPEGSPCSYFASVRVANDVGLGSDVYRLPQKAWLWWMSQKLVLACYGIVRGVVLDAPTVATVKHHAATPENGR